tara:strand:+ start:1504 stop:1722 length:219 start_codon:yes stop_codon:yes gene_type:complete
MKKIKKIKIRLNGKLKSVNKNISLLELTNNIKIPFKKVAIELNQVIVDKKKMSKIIIKNNDRIEIVHFIGGG